MSVIMTGETQSSVRPWQRYAYFITSGKSRNILSPKHNIHEHDEACEILKNNYGNQTRYSQNNWVNSYQSKTLDKTSVRLLIKSQTRWLSSTICIHMVLSYKIIYMDIAKSKNKHRKKYGGRIAVSR